MRIEIAHTTRLDYSADVVEGIMDVRLGPLSDADQRWDLYELRVEPLASVRRYTDGFGNQAHLLTLARPHRYVEVVSRGEVETFLGDPFVLPTAPPPALRPSELADYCAPSPLVEPHRELMAIAEPYRPRAASDAFESVRQLMDSVYRTFSYQQHVTSVTTTVPEVLGARAGVCQDFAHVLLGLCRAIDVPARYVSGYIVVSGQAQSQGSAGQWQSQSQSSGEPGPSRGAGASHAWIEAWTPTYGWRGFDPTNNLLASANHVKMAIGRDYSDVPPTRGTFRGTADERLSVDVRVVRRD